jgi:hypothetical protein
MIGDIGWQWANFEIPAAYWSEKHRDFIVAIAGYVRAYVVISFPLILFTFILMNTINSCGVEQVNQTPP